MSSSRYPRFRPWWPWPSDSVPSDVWSGKENDLQTVENLLQLCDFCFTFCNLDLHPQHIFPGVRSLAVCVPWLCHEAPSGKLLTAKRQREVATWGDLQVTWRRAKWLKWLQDLRAISWNPRCPWTASHPPWWWKLQKSLNIPMPPHLPSTEMPREESSELLRVWLLTRGRWMKSRTTTSPRLFALEDCFFFRERGGFETPPMETDVNVPED